MSFYETTNVGMQSSTALKSGQTVGLGEQVTSTVALPNATSANETVTVQAQTNSTSKSEAIAGAKQRLAQFRRGAPFSDLERDAQIDVFATGDGNTTDAGNGLSIAQLFSAGTTVLIVAGVVAIVLGSLLIWPAAIAVKQSKEIKSFEREGLLSIESAKPASRTARVMAILTAILGAVATLFALGSLVTGMGALSVGAVLAIAMLVVGAIAAHRLAKFESEKDEAPRKRAGGVSHAASALWITAMVLGLLIPGLASLAVGSVLKSKENKIKRAIAQRKE